PQTVAGAPRPTDTAGVVSLGRSMGASYALSARVTPLTGQYNLQLRLYEVAGGHVAEENRNVGSGEAPQVVPDMLVRVFAAVPGAPGPAAPGGSAQPPPRPPDGPRAGRGVAPRTRVGPARVEVDRTRRVYRYAEGGRVSVGAGGLLGGRVTAPPARP